MSNIQLYDLGYCDEKEFTRVVCVCKYNGKYVFLIKKEMVGSYQVDILKMAKAGKKQPKERYMKKPALQKLTLNQFVYIK